MINKKKENKNNEKRELGGGGRKWRVGLPKCLVLWGNKDKRVYEKVETSVWESKVLEVYEDKMRVVGQYCFALGDFSTRYAWSKWRFSQKNRHLERSREIP